MNRDRLRAPGRRHVHAKCAGVLSRAGVELPRGSANLSAEICTSRAARLLERRAGRVICRRRVHPRIVVQFLTGLSEERDEQVILGGGRRCRGWRVWSGRTTARSASDLGSDPFIRPGDAPGNRSGAGVGGRREGGVRWNPGPCVPPDFQSVSTNYVLVEKLVPVRQGIHRGLR